MERLLGQVILKKAGAKRQRFLNMFAKRIIIF